MKSRLRPETIVLWDLPTDPRELLDLLHSLAPFSSESQLVLAFHDDDTERMKNRANQAFPDEHGLRKAYVTVAQLCQAQEGGITDESFALAMQRRWPGLMSAVGIQRALEIFAELGLLKRENGRVQMRAVTGGKVDLEASLLYNECTLLRTVVSTGSTSLTTCPPDEFFRWIAQSVHLGDKRLAADVS